MKEAELIELNRDASREWHNSTNLRKRAKGEPLPQARVVPNQFKGKYALDVAGMKIFHDKVKNGTIPIGPKPDHSTGVVDRRDKTNSEEIGMAIIARRNGGK